MSLPAELMRSGCKIGEGDSSPERQVKSLWILTWHPLRKPRRWVFLCLFAAAAVLIVTVGTVMAQKASDKRIIRGKNLRIVVQDEGDIRRIAGFFGADASCAEIDWEEVTIPRYFNETYQHYNDLQTAIGCDLQPFAGQRCRLARLRFPKGHPQEDCTMTLMICNGKWIGGDLSSSRIDGAMVSLGDEIVG